LMCKQSRPQMPLPLRQTHPEADVRLEAADGYEAAEATVAARLGDALPSLGLDEGACRPESADSESYHLDRVTVQRPLDDGSLGLVLRGTFVDGFAAPEAEAAGWTVGDKIVEVAGCSVGTFKEFLAQLHFAQEAGYPITFSVLRRQQAELSRGTPEAADASPATVADHAAKDNLDGFFGETTLADLAGQLRSKFGANVRRKCEDQGASSSSSTLPGDSDSQPSARSLSVMDNPYVQALQKRRDELFRSVEGWSSEVAASLASRLATERSDALATLVKPPWETPRTADELPDLPSSLAWAMCIPTGPRPCGRTGEAKACIGCEIAPTPRVDVDSEACRYLDQVLTWEGQMKLPKEVGSDRNSERPQNLAVRLLPHR